MKRNLLLAVLLMMNTSPAGAAERADPGDPGDAVVARWRSFRPDASWLSVYRLDWCDDLATARARAASENRPVLVVTVTNISGGGNIRSGHC